MTIQGSKFERQRTDDPCVASADQSLLAFSVSYLYLNSTLSLVAHPSSHGHALRFLQARETLAMASKGSKAKKPAAHPPYSEMIKEAIVTLKEKSGSSPHAIGKFIEDKHKAHLPPNFRKFLLIQIKKLAAEGKLTKIKSSFKLSAPAKPKPKSKPASTASKSKSKSKPAGSASKPKAKTNPSASTAKPKPKATPVKPKPKATPAKPKPKAAPKPKPKTATKRPAKAAKKDAPAKKVGEKRKSPSNQKPAVRPAKAAKIGKKDTPTKKPKSAKPAAKKATPRK